MNCPARGRRASRTVTRTRLGRVSAGDAVEGAERRTSGARPARRSSTASMKPVSRRDHDAGRAPAPRPPASAGRPPRTREERGGGDADGDSAARLAAAAATASGRAERQPATGAQRAGRPRPGRTAGSRARKRRRAREQPPLLDLRREPPARARRATSRARPAAADGRAPARAAAAPAARRRGSLDRLVWRCPRPSACGLTQGAASMLDDAARPAKRPSRSASSMSDKVVPPDEHVVTRFAPSPPASCISAARARPCSTGSTPSATAARCCCASRTPTGSARPTPPSRRSSTA